MKMNKNIMEKKDKEIWKDIKGYEGSYQVSSMGRLRSLDRTTITKNGNKMFFRGRILEGSINKDGYRIFTLSINGKGKTFSLAQIAAITFLSHTPNGSTLVVDHINGDKLDDRVENLRIVTHRENLSTCYRSNKETFTSKYVGVYWHKNNSKWRAEIQYKGVTSNLGYYDDELEAYQAYQNALNKINDETFNPDDYKPNFTSKHKGVYFYKQSNKWQSQIRVNGKQKHLGFFNTELEAFNAIQKFKRNSAIHKFKQDNGLYKHLSVA